MKKFTLILIGALVMAGCGTAEVQEEIVVEEEPIVEEVEEPAEVEKEPEAEKAPVVEEKVEPKVEVEVEAEVEAEVATEFKYDMAEVAKHSGEGDCWSVINGAVYDLTSWISQHPGGAANILKICGKDGSAAFNGKHGGSDHAKSHLSKYYLSDLEG